MSKERKYFSPTEKNLGKDCLYWGQKLGCIFPKVELESRKSCDGVVDDMCLFFKDGRPPRNYTQEMLLELRKRVANNPLEIPPGDILP